MMPQAPQPIQPSLLADVIRDEHPWKRTTGTSREAVRVFEASGGAASLRRKIPLVIRALWNRTQRSPTSDEIARECFKRRYIADAHPDHVKPRLTELSKGHYRRVKGPNGVVAKVLVGGGLIETAGKRKSERSGVSVHTWRVIERGTGQ